ncbi:hypothetical protein Bca4012_004378 [Brassica carinata]
MLTATEHRLSVSTSILTISLSKLNQMPISLSMLFWETRLTFGVPELFPNQKHGFGVI